MQLETAGKGPDPRGKGQFPRLFLHGRGLCPQLSLAQPEHAGADIQRAAARFQQGVQAPGEGGLFFARLCACLLYTSAFAAEGASLILTGRTLSKLERAKAALEADFGVKVCIVTADGGSEEDVKNAIEAGVKEFGHLDTVVNNAQNSASGVMLVDHTKEDFDKAKMCIRDRAC